eukprot:scaffold133530_cov105-Phaeocystis_antarctica.AAC.1
MLAGASEWTYGRHAELLTGVPNPPELDPTADRTCQSAERGLCLARARATGSLGLCCRRRS